MSYDVSPWGSWEPGRMHLRLLEMVDELHRIGFEQLRFSRSRATQHLRLQVYAARHVQGPDVLVATQAIYLVVSDENVMVINREDAYLAQKWQELLAGSLKPRHLAGLFVLDFPEIARSAYGADHAYREWFRSLRPSLQQGMLPLTYDEDAVISGIGTNFEHYTEMKSAKGELTLLPAPPLNPYRFD